MFLNFKITTMMEEIKINNQLLPLSHKISFFINLVATNGLKQFLNVVELLKKVQSSSLNYC